MSRQSSLARARELVPDQVLFIAAQLDTSGGKYGVINETRKSCHRRGRTVLVRSFFHISLSMSGSCKIVSVFKAHNLKSFTPFFIPMSERLPNLA